MYENQSNKKTKYAKLMIISFFVVIMFIVGFLAGGSYIYGLSSSQVDDLENQINNLQKNNNDNTYISTYYYNETSLSNIYNNVKDSIVVISGIVYYQTFFSMQSYEVQGSGFIYSFDDEYVVITNNHVVSDVSDIVVTFSNGDSYPGEVIGSDAYSDLAVLYVNAPIAEFLPLAISDSSTLEVGDPVIAIGSPMGLYNTMTTGIISQVGRTIQESTLGNYPIANIIQTNVAINPGNSGGPLLNYQGQVVGITTAIIEDSEGIGFAIPSNTILKEIESLVKTGSYTQHSWLGISGIDMSYSIANITNADVTYGWLITSLTSDGPAEKAGLQAGDQQIRTNTGWIIIGGDIIIEIDGTRIINGDSLMSYIEEQTHPNDTITVTVLRNNQTLDIPVILGQRPSLN